MTDAQKIWAVKLLGQILDDTDPAVYPETTGIAAGALSSPAPDEQALLAVANALMGADSTLEMPACAARFIEFVLADAADNGSSEAALNLGAYYYTGRGSGQDYQKAVHYYELAADAGEILAFENLGYCYYYGRVSEPDYDKAYHCFVRSALEGSLRALYKIGDMFKSGLYVRKDENQAYRLYSRAASFINENNVNDVGADIFMRLAGCHLYGCGTGKDPELALSLYEEAERLFMHRLKSGDYMIEKNYRLCIERQQEARLEAQKSLPGFDWAR